MNGTREIRIDGNVSHAIPRMHIETRLDHALGRMPIAPITARVTFSDANGPKGGADVRCALQVTLPHQPVIHIERSATNARVAFDESYDRLVRHLERTRERWLNGRRHPKKYYAAKRAAGAA